MSFPAEHSLHFESLNPYSPLCLSSSGTTAVSQLLLFRQISQSLS
uniref:Uncharacterized protein n=1 Tax=Anguilla anguilla TaxID=7936 RepID=A0A0E9R6U9_ANGAN